MRLMLAFNRNMLVLFLLGNVMTGVVNLSLNTLSISSWGSRCIVGEGTKPERCQPVAGFADLFPRSIDTANCSRQRVMPSSHASHEAQQLLLLLQSRNIMS
jgi:hypothetical protein